MNGAKAPARQFALTVPATVDVPVLDRNGDPVLDDKGKPKIAPHLVELTICYPTASIEGGRWVGRGQISEIVVASDSKIGNQLDRSFANLGVKISRAIQGRDPDTGAPMETGNA